MNAYEIIKQANYDIDHNIITLGEWEKRIEPTKNVKPIVYGEWEYIHDTFSKRKCKECGYTEVIVDGMADNFCPKCGANMRNESEEEE